MNTGRNGGWRRITRWSRPNMPRSVPNLPRRSASGVAPGAIRRGRQPRNSPQPTGKGQKGRPRRPFRWAVQGPSPPPSPAKRVEGQGEGLPPWRAPWQPLIQSVKPGDVVVDDLLLRAFGKAGEVLLQGLVRVWPDAVRVRIIRAPDDVVLADQRHDRLEVFVLLIGDKALAAEIIRGLHLEAEAACPVVVLGVAAVEHIRQPGHPGLAEDEVELGVFLAGAGGEDRGQDLHRVELEQR